MPQKHLFNLADNEYQYWKPFNYSGKSYDFEHLKARKMTFDRPDNSEIYTFIVTISHHVFTISIDSNQAQNHDVDLLYEQKKTGKRVFCDERYSLSLQLHKIIENLHGEFCYHGHYTRYCACKLKDKHGNIISYQVVFKVWKEDNKLRLYVESAYPLKQGLKKPKKVSFWVICYNLLNGRKMPTPNK